MSRRKLIECFEDTMSLCASDKTLVEGIERSRNATALVRADDALEVPMHEQRGACANVAVSLNRTFEAAHALLAACPERKVAVLNFASSVNPGGGVKNGSGAQEECLCRCSTLYPCLDVRELWDGFYAPNRAARNPLANDDCIYTPNITVIKDDTLLPTLLPRDEWYSVDVITCAAPNLRNLVQLSSDELRQIHVSRARRILRVAASKGVQALVLGAFGCGAFCNDPVVVADAWHSVVRERGGWFHAIEFAVWCPPHDRRNYQAFLAAFAQ